MNKAADLRAMADIIDATELEENPVGGEWVGVSNSFTLHVLCDTAEEVTGVRERFAGLGGKWNKYATENYFGLKAEIQRITIDIYADRGSVCEAVEEEVTEMVPDPNAPLVEVTKTKITWKCPESLLAEVGE